MFVFSIDRDVIAALFGIDIHYQNPLGKEA